MQQLCNNNNQKDNALFLYLMCNFYVSIMELSHKKAFYLQLHQGFTFKDEKLICNPCRGISPSKVCDGCGMDFAPGEKKSWL